MHKSCSKSPASLAKKPWPGMATHDGPCRGHGRHRRGSQRELPILFFSTDIGMVGIVAASHPEPFSCFFPFLIVHGPLPNLYVDLAFFREQKAPYKCETVPETHSISETLMVFAVGGQLGILLTVHQSPPCGTVHPCLWHSTPLWLCGTVHPCFAGVALVATILCHWLSMGVSIK